MLVRPHDPDTLRNRMLECSGLRIEEAANSADRHAWVAAHRVLETAKAWHDWEASHNQLISHIATQRNVAQQSLAAKLMALSMIHRKAPLEYGREYSVRGGARQRFFQTLYGSRETARAVVQGHRHYLRAMCSYLCVDRFCGGGSLQYIRDYERRMLTTGICRRSARAGRSRREDDGGSGCRRVAIAAHRSEGVTRAVAGRRSQRRRSTYAG